MQKYRGILLVIIFFTLITSKAIAQFHYDRIEDDLSFFSEKKFELFATPRYNRVEGLHLQGNFKFRPDSSGTWLLYANPGIGFWNDGSDKFTNSAGFRKDFFDFQRLSIGGEVFKQTRTKDEWQIREMENTLYSFLFRDDFRDYYATKGFKVFADHKFRDNHIWRVEFGRQTYDTLEVNVDWSVFGGEFKDNPRTPFLAEGDEIGLRLITALDWRDDPIFTYTGWYIEGIFEKTFEDFKTDGLFITVRRYQQTWGNQRVLARARLGSRHGSLAAQHTLDLGGIGTLRGFDDKEFVGNRMVLFNANYLFNGDISQRIPLHGIPFFGNLWTAISFGAFFDAGWLNTVDPEEGMFNGFGDLALDDFKANLGLSVLVLEGVLRLDIAKRTDRSNDDFRVTFRFLENF